MTVEAVVGEVGLAALEPLHRDRALGPVEVVTKAVFPGSTILPV
eukprot:CAMPEP_0118995954 /NCGR_PEP_ID=MMETSP1173-20130426/59277_1 /TAXON_ID=1034831 /ORGANISM="Rhizochromulina marina cf, Strain CCMP1243" /LENGTH=43 /DNA_ID= /DNA_START= /DNA_END= /DNA_ORIENTATION=